MFATKGILLVVIEFVHDKESFQTLKSIIYLEVSGTL